MSTRPAWDDDPIVASWVGLPVLDAAVTADVCVVGLGGSGLAAVDALVSRGLDVVGIDAGRTAAGAAGRNGGFLLGGPASFLHSAIESWGEVAVELYRKTLEEIDSLEAKLGSSVIRRTGSIRLAGLPGDTDDVELSDCRILARVLGEHGIAAETYDDELGRGIFLPDDAVMNPARRALGLASQLLRRAQLFEHSPVTSIRSGRVDTRDRSVSAPFVIVAVDGNLDRIFPRLRGRIRTARLQMLSTEPVLSRRLPCPVYGRWGYDYAQQDSDGRLYVGGGRDLFADDEWTDSDEPTAAVQRHIESVARSMAGHPVTVISRWAASVGFTADGRPLCTTVDDGVIALGGYNGTGNLVGPVAARAAVEHLLDGAPVPAFLST